MAGSRKMEKDGERNSDVFDLFISVTRYALHVTFYTSHVNKGIKIVEFKGKKA